MLVNEAIIGRRSVRSFTEKSVSDEIVNSLLNAACWAPSAGNVQPWHFIVVRKNENKEKLIEACFYEAKFVAEAPVVIVVCADPAFSARMYDFGDRGSHLYCLQDTAAATQNIHLLAFSLGLGTCWIGGFDEAKVKSILNIPVHIRPVAIIPVGYPKDLHKKGTRNPISEKTHWETF
jgi:nitroreductase